MAVARRPVEAINVQLVPQVAYHDYGIRAMVVCTGLRLHVPKTRSDRPVKTPSPPAPHPPIVMSVLVLCSPADADCAAAALAASAARRTASGGRPTYRLRVRLERGPTLPGTSSNPASPPPLLPRSLLSATAPACRVHPGQSRCSPQSPGACDGTGRTRHLASRPPPHRGPVIRTSCYLTVPVMHAVLLLHWSGQLLGKAFRRASNTCLLTSHRGAGL